MLLVRNSLFALIGCAVLMGPNGSLMAKPALCECPVMECGPCEQKTGEDFYSEDCGKNMVRSCKKPRCEPMEGAELKQCQLQMTQPESVTENTSKKSKNPEPEVQLKYVDLVPEGKTVGVIMVSQGPSWISRQGSEKSRAKVGFRIHEKDILETGDNGKMKVVFNNKNSLVVAPQSKIKIVLNQSDSTEDKDKTLLHLMYGKVRNQVQKQYDGKKNSFEVKTGAAVAGVRGTDFVTTFEKNSDGYYAMKVETLKGVVQLAGLSKDESQKKVDILKGEYASYVSEGIDRDLFSDEDIDKFVSKGYLTPVFKMSEQEIKKIVQQTEINADERSIASEKGSKICSTPDGSMNQCSWICRNNPRGEKRCRTDLPGVDCVRRRCNASGVWADEFRLPASYHSSCEPEGTTVGPCDY